MCAEAFFCIGALSAFLLLSTPARAADPDPPAASSQPAPDDDAIRAEVLAVRRVHADRMARLRRLRELAWEADDRKRLDQLDDLHEQTAASFERRVEQLRARMSPQARQEPDEPHPPPPDVRDRRQKTKLQNLELRQQARRQREDLRDAARREQLLLQQQAAARASAPADASSRRRRPSRAGDRWRLEANATAAADRARRAGGTRDAWADARLAELQRRRMIDRLRSGGLATSATVEGSHGSPALTQADRRAEKMITADNADEELERLRRELAGVPE